MPSQSLSIPSRSSRAPGKVVGSLSAQSPMQTLTLSRSPSKPSSTCRLQLLSRPSQTSMARGWTAGSWSSQSPCSMVNPSPSMSGITAGALPMRPRGGGSSPPQPVAAANPRPRHKRVETGEAVPQSASHSGRHTAAGPALARTSRPVARRGEPRFTSRPSGKEKAAVKGRLLAVLTRRVRRGTNLVAWFSGGFRAPCRRTSSPLVGMAPRVVDRPVFCASGCVPCRPRQAA